MKKSRRINHGNERGLFASALEEKVPAIEEMYAGTGHS